MIIFLFFLVPFLLCNGVLFYCSAVLLLFTPYCSTVQLFCCSTVLGSSRFIFFRSPSFSAFPRLVLSWSPVLLVSCPARLSPLLADVEKALQLAILGGEFMERNRYNDSDKWLKRAFKVSLFFGIILILLAHKLCHQQQIYREVTSVDNTAILLRLACLYQQKNSLLLAEKFLEKALDISTRRLVANAIVLNCHIGLMTNYQLAGDLTKATDYCRELVDKNGGVQHVKTTNSVKHTHTLACFSPPPSSLIIPPCDSCCIVWSCRWRGQYSCRKISSSGHSGNLSRP